MFTNSQLCVKGSTLYRKTKPEVVLHVRFRTKTKQIDLNQCEVSEVNIIMCLTLGLLNKECLSMTISDVLGQKVKGQGSSNIVSYDNHLKPKVNVGYLQYIV